ncbi:hypothetical protein M9435_001346 [Picochlorum sp. BPE23]|nr:hypothetical protein M9435_001346 [Picochlorum sp. BPE23]
MAVRCFLFELQYPVDGSVGDVVENPINRSIMDKILHRLSREAALRGWANAARGKGSEEGLTRLFQATDGVYCPKMNIMSGQKGGNGMGAYGQRRFISTVPKDQPNRGGKDWQMPSLQSVMKSNKYTPPLADTTKESKKNGLSALLRGPSSLQKALSLHVEALWDRHHRKLYAGVALLGAWTIWKSMRFTASAFVNVSESLAVTGLTTLGASATLVVAAWYYRHRFMISPSSVYRMAMFRLNSHPGVLEVMGAPVLGSDVRASVVTGGGLKLKGWKPKLKSRRVQMIFPLRGSERKGLVSLEAKNRKGKVTLSLLAVDVPMPASMGGEQRIYIEGGIKAYDRGGVLNELRRPFLSALSTEDAAEEEDDAEELRAGREARFLDSSPPKDKER